MVWFDLPVNLIRQQLPVLIGRDSNNRITNKSRGLCCCRANTLWKTVISIQQLSFLPTDVCWGWLLFWLGWLVSHLLVIRTTLARVVAWAWSCRPSRCVQVLFSFLPDLKLAVLLTKFGFSRLSRGQSLAKRLFSEMILLISLTTFTVWISDILAP